MLPLYARVLGSSFDTLPPVLKRLHDIRPRKRYAGRCVVERGTGLLARLIARVAGLPESERDVAIEVEIERNGTRETWTRRFGALEMRSVLDSSHRYLEERLRGLRLCFELSADSGRIAWRLRRARFLFVPLPPSWFSGCTAYEAGDGPRYRFDVSAHLRGIGLVVRYRGWMVEHDE